MFENFRRVLTEKLKDPNTTKKRSKNQAGENTAGAALRPMYRAASCQSSGIERINNEDAIFTFECSYFVADMPTTVGIYIIADGMGGHHSGEIASGLAAQCIGQFLVEKIMGLGLSESCELPDEDLKELIKEAISVGQSCILQNVPGGGTTLTLVVALNERLFLAHVGDSRLYVIDHENKIHLKSKDHSLVKRLVELGEISESEVQQHPQRNVLYKAMGQDDPFDPDMDCFSINPGEYFLICSDGLWGVLNEQKMLDMIKQERNFTEIPCQLVAAANDLGGPDNISVVLVERLI